MEIQRTVARLWAVLAVAGIVVGCAGGTDSGGSSELDKMAQRLDEKVDADAQAARDEAAAEARSKADSLAAEGTSELSLDDMQRGQHVKGGGYLQTVVRGGIRGQQKLNLATVEHALNLYWGLEGHWPESHDEFMEKVIKANGIQLEPLQEPYEYRYNPEDHTLYKRVKPEAVEAAEAEAQAAESEAANN